MYRLTSSSTTTIIKFSTVSAIYKNIVKDLLFDYYHDNYSLIEYFFMTLQSSENQTDTNTLIKTLKLTFRTKTNLHFSSEEMSVKVKNMVMSSESLHG